MTPRFIFSHGWGFSANYWNNLRPYFSEVDSIYLDAGYYGDQNLDYDIDSTCEYIGIGHSLGLIRLLSLNVPFKALVGVQGFINFLGDSPLRRKRIIELRAFTNLFLNDPIMLLKHFYQQAGVPLINNARFEKYNSEKLCYDLKELLPNKFELPSHVPTLILGASNDPIVPVELIEDNFSLASSVKIVIHENGKHALGFDQPDFIHAQIMGFVDEYR